MIKNLVLIRGFSIIVWLIGRVTSAETPIHVSGDVYTIINQQLQDNHYPSNVYETDDAKSAYESYFVSTNTDNKLASEVCHWGKLAVELNEPTNDICIIVAVALKDKIAVSSSSTVSSSSSELSVSSYYSNYDCPELSIANMDELDLGEENYTDSLNRKIEETVLFCPRITIDDSSTSEPITVERFLIGDGDETQNSIFVYLFTNNIGEMNLTYYLDNITRFDIIRILQISTTAQYSQMLYNLEQTFELDDEFCNASITEKKNICKYSAMRKVYSENGGTLWDDFDDNLTYYDTSGFVPYICFRRYYSAELMGFTYPENQIYCPKQVIQMAADTIYEQDGFFYSVHTDANDKLYLCNNASHVNYRDNHRIYITNKLNVPMNTSGNTSSELSQIASNFGNLNLEDT